MQHKKSKPVIELTEKEKLLIDQLTTIQKKIQEELVKIDNTAENREARRYKIDKIQVVADTIRFLNHEIDEGHLTYSLKDNPRYNMVEKDDKPAKQAAVYSTTRSSDVHTNTNSHIHNKIMEAYTLREKQHPVITDAEKVDKLEKERASYHDRPTNRK